MRSLHRHRTANVTERPATHPGHGRSLTPVSPGNRDAIHYVAHQKPGTPCRRGLRHVSLKAGMRISQALRNSVWIVALCLCAQEQTPPAKDAPAKETPANEIKGMPPRVGPADYQAQALLGGFTIAADFTEHSIPTPQGLFTTEDYVVVETGLYGPSGSHLTLSTTDFSLRINGKKTPAPSQPYGVVFSSAKDPSWEPPEPPSKSKTGITSGDSGADAGSKPAPVHMPMPLQHAMQQKIQKAALPEGDRPLPQAGLLFFSYRGQSKGIYSVELIYSGPAGKTTLSLHP